MATEATAGTDPTDDTPPQPTGTPVREEDDDRAADTHAWPYGWR